MAKSPFARDEVRTYTYPEPMNEPKHEGESDPAFQARQDNIDPEVVQDKDNLPWIKIRVPHSRKDVDAVADRTQSLVIGALGEDSPGLKFEQQIARGNRALFELLVEEWFFPEYDAPATGANYERLGDWAGAWVTSVLADAVRRGTTRDFAKKMNGSSSEPENSQEPSLEQPLAEPHS